MISGKLAEVYIIENKKVSLSSAARVMEKKGGKMGLVCPKLLKTNGDKVPVFRLSKMLMKINELDPSLQDVDEKKGVRRLARCREKSRARRALYTGLRHQR